MHILLWAGIAIETCSPVRRLTWGYLGQVTLHLLAILTGCLSPAIQCLVTTVWFALGNSLPLCEPWGNSCLPTDCVLLKQSVQDGGGLCGTNSEHSNTYNRVQCGNLVLEPLSLKDSSMRKRRTDQTRTFGDWKRARLLGRQAGNSRRMEFFGLGIKFGEQQEIMEARSGGGNVALQGRYRGRVEYPLGLNALQMYVILVATVCSNQINSKPLSPLLLRNTMLFLCL